MQKRLYVFYSERLEWTSGELVQAGWRVGEQFIGKVQGLYGPKVDGCGMREKARLGEWSGNQEIKILNG